MIKRKVYRLMIIFCLALVLPIVPGTRNDKITAALQRAITHSGVNQIQVAWIFFTDKGPNLQQRIKQAIPDLDLGCRRRRMKRTTSSQLVDAYDVPVFEQYFKQISTMANKIRHQSRWLNAVSVEASGQILQTIAAFTFVRKIDRVKRFHRPMQPPPSLVHRPLQTSTPESIHSLNYGKSLTQVKQIKVPTLHDMGYSGRGVIICMLDSGFNHLEHEALQGVKIAGSWDFVNNDNNVDDESGDMGGGGHGTQTLSVIAGYKPGELIGPAYNATFLLGKTENTDWERHIEEDHWVAGAEWAEGKGADIISSSLSYRDQFTHGESDYTWEQMDGKTTIVTQGANIAASKGVLVFNSAGNEGASIPPESTIGGPADSPQVVAVGAVSSDENRVNFSSTGPTADGRIKPDIMAMGENVYAASPTDADGYRYVDGTSFSCPLTAGAAALILEANPSWSNLDVIQALQQTSSQANSPDHFMGYGLVNTLAASNHQIIHFLPPLNFKLLRLENNFIFFVEYINQLSWSSNPENNIPVEHYRIYMKTANSTTDDYVLLVELDDTVSSFFHRGLQENQ